MWKYKLQLSPDETLRFEGRHQAGAGRLVLRYTILDPQGGVTGTVQLTEALLPASPLRSELHLLQRNAFDDTIVDLRWTA